MRDMVQNHMLQLLTLVGMEPPVSLHADAVRGEKVKVLHAIRRMDPELVNHATVRGQYTAGYISGEHVVGYREEERVSPQSTTETYVALQLFIDNWRWAGVPFYLRTGKRLAKRISEIAIQFKPAPHALFQNEAPFEAEPNMLVLEIQPDEGINMRFKVKVPGPRMQLRPVNMLFQYGAAFNAQSPDAYERLLLDAMLGEGTLFTRRDEVEAAWDIVDRIIAGWHMEPVESLPGYEAGGWGPRESDTFMTNERRSWRRP
jgi:glucose-6-phosphate 1-dehydrogenase